jgi:hypothetical protein
VTALDRTEPDDRGWWDRFLLSFMGPPDIGDPNEPVRVIDLPVALCPKCREPYDLHEIVREPRLTYSRCPAVAG